MSLPKRQRHGTRRITGGKATQGAGIYDNGSANLSINQCDISNNHAVGKLFNPIQGTAGAGIFVATPPKFGPQGGILTVAVSGSTIVNNRTDTNDDTDDPKSDLGGGMYLAANVSLSMSGSTVQGNFAENAAGGIYFGGGMFNDLPDPIFGYPRVKATHLGIGACRFEGNSATSSLKGAIAGALYVGDATGGMISDTTFVENAATNSGGAIFLTGFGSESKYHSGVPYRELIGQVNLVGCTLKQNAAAGPKFDLIGDPLVVDNGGGGGVFMEGVANELYVVNSTLSANTAGFGDTKATGYGKGGGIAVQGSRVDYNHKAIFIKDYDLRQLVLALDQTDPDPGPPHFGESLLEIDNSTVAENFANGAKDDSNVFQGGRGGGMAVLPVTPADFQGDMVINSSIIATNKVSENGYGPDTYAADTAAGSFATGTKNLHGITDSGNFSIPLATSNTVPPVALGETLSLPLDPLLKSLAFNGGMTETHAIDHLSPAYNTGANVIPVMYEQRGPGTYDNRDVGLLRVDKVSNLPDIGAYELQPAKVVMVNSFAETEYQGVVYITMSHSRVNSIWVTFNQPVAMPLGAGAALSLRQYYDGVQFVDLTVDTTASLSTNNMMARLTFSGVRTESDDNYVNPSLIDGKYQLTVNADAVLVDEFELDGNCDGLPGDDYSTSTTNDKSPNFQYRLFGDVIGVDMAVASNDFNAFKTAFGGNGNIAQFDFDGDGACDNSDFNAFRQRFGSSFP